MRISQLEMSGSSGTYGSYLLAHLQRVGVAEGDEVPGAVRQRGAHGERAAGAPLRVRVRGAGRAVVRQQVRLVVQRARARPAAADLERVHLQVPNVS